MPELGLTSLFDLEPKKFQPSATFAYSEEELEEPKKTYRYRDNFYC